MRHLSVFTLVIAVMLVSGCDSLNHRQYLLVPALSNSQYEDLRAELGKALEPVVEKHKLIDSRSGARDSGVVFYYKTKSNFPIQVGAKITNTGVVVDVMQFHPGTGEGEEYSKVVQDIVSALSSMNSVKVVELRYGNHVE